MLSEPCSATIKDKFGNHVKCGLTSKGECPNVRLHLGKYKSGACGIGCHEGENPKNMFGRPLPTCTSWQTCNCKCHLTYDQMFAMTNQERLLVNHSSYVPDHSSFVMPDPEELALARVSSMGGGPTTPSAPRIVPSELPDAVPATIERTFGQTPTGRAAKGELEAQVKWACDDWLIEHSTLEEQELHRCTPVYVSEEIGRKYGIKNPSVGAIDAVWKRWVKIRFATTATKPTRFVGYTVDGVRLTLEGCKDRYRRNKH